MSEGAPKDFTKTGEEPTKIIEINGVRYELGPYLGELELEVIDKKISELNNALEEGEKEWRMLTQKDYEKLREPMLPIINDKSLSIQERMSMVYKYAADLGFQNGKIYFSVLNRDETNDKALYQFPYDGLVIYPYVQSKLSVQCVREV